jgi:4-amino-4-deoxy-L-arabinose transferase-like glycosyltransferase
MTTNRYLKKGFIYGTMALVVGIISQLILSTSHVLLAVLLLSLATGFFVFILHNQPGPNVVLTSYSPFQKDSGAQKGNLLKTIIQINFGTIYHYIQGAIKALFRSILAWQNQNRLITGMVALVVGVAGQYMLLANQLLIGAIVTGLAIILFVILFRKQSDHDSTFTENLFIQKPMVSQGSPLGGIALGFAILFAGLAFWLFGTSIPSIFPWLLHLSSIGLLIFSCYWMNKFKAPLRILENQPRNTIKWTWLEIGIFIAILAIAAFMRLYRFDQIPFGTWYDEADYALNALKILNVPGYLPVYVESTQLPAHFIYLIALSIRILGVSTLSIRAVSVVFGLGTVVAAYFAGREIFDRRMGFVLAFLMAVSRWDVIWSRIGMHGVTVPFFELITIALIFKALRRQRLIDYSLAGLSMGMGICFYFSFRLFPLVISLFLLVLWWNHRNFFRTSWRGLLVLCLGLFIASVPVTQLAVNQPKAFWGRINSVSIFNGKTALEGWQAASRTTLDHLLMFNYQGDRNGRHNLPGEPMLDPISGALLVLGTGLSLWRIRQPVSLLLIAWLLIMLAPGIFSLDFEAPQSLRAIGSLPAAYLLAAVPIHALWQEWDHFSEKRPATFFIIPLFVVLIMAGYINYHIYFDLQAKNADSWSAFSTPETIIGKKMAELGPQVDYYVSVFYYNAPTIEFLAPEITAYHLLQTYDSLPIPTDGKRTIVFFVDADEKPFFLQAQHYYPKADFTEYKAPNGTVVLYQITLMPSDIAASQGITTSYYSKANWSDQPFLVGNEPTIDIDWKEGSPVGFPFGVKWQGVLYADHYGLYHLTLKSPAPSELYLDNVQIPFVGEGVQTSVVELAKGCHNLIISTTAGKEGHFELDWQPPDGELAPIPSSNLFLPPISNNGLLGKYFPNGNWQDPPAFTQVDPWIHFFFQEQPLPRPYTVEWVGKINIIEGGLYRFGLESIDESVLFVDDVRIVNANQPDVYQESAVDLSPGFHSIRIRYADRSGYSHINLYWTPPDSERENIPQEVLFLP